MDNAANNFHVSRVQLELGSVATDFERRLFVEELAMCQRYYHKTFPQGTTPAQSASTLGAIVYRVSSAGAISQPLHVTFPVQMRASPTIIFYNTSESSAKWWNATDVLVSGDASTLRLGANGMGIDNAQVAGDGVAEQIEINYSAEAEL